MITQKKPTLIIVAGPNGSGKTTITEKLLRHKWMENCRYINPDVIAQQEFGDWNSLEAVIKAANHAKDIREKCFAHRENMAFETVFSTPEKVEFIKRAKNAGFFVRLFFVCTNDPTINAQRVALRVMEGGHDVPIPKIINRYYKSIANCAYILPYVDRAYFYDNSLTDVDPFLMFRVSERKIANIYGNFAPWVQDIANSLEKK